MKSGDRTKQQHSCDRQAIDLIEPGQQQLRDGQSVSWLPSEHNEVREFKREALPRHVSCGSLWLVVCDIPNDDVDSPADRAGLVCLFVP